MYRIDTGTLQLSLEVVPVDALLQHEEVLPDAAHELVLEFRNMVTLQNPIIVDENNLVLDGNHRAYAFKHLGFKYISVCRVDYFHESIKLRYWFRLLTRIKEPGLFKQIVKKTGGTFKPVKSREALNAILREDKLSWGIEQGRAFSLISFDKEIVYDAVSAYDCLETIQRKMTGAGAHIVYIPSDHEEKEGFTPDTNDADIILHTPHITKQMVVKAGKKGTVFAPKTTRHLIPARPLQVNVPAYWFKENISLEEIQKRFSRFLQKKTMKRFGPGQVLGGRYYEEELFVFYDKE